MEQTELREQLEEILHKQKETVWSSNGGHSSVNYYSFSEIMAAMKEAFELGKASLVKVPTKELKYFFEMVSVKTNPENEGWYQTNEGIMYYLHGDKKGGWSSREDRMSEEYPKFWYKPIELNLPTNVKVPTDELNKIIEIAGKAKDRYDYYFKM